MQVSLFTWLVVIGSLFSLAAAAMAYIISYTEYEKHFLQKKRAVVISLQSAFFIFLLFIAITLAIAFFFGTTGGLKPAG